MIEAVNTSPDYDRGRREEWSRIIDWLYEEAAVFRERGEIEAWLAVRQMAEALRIGRLW
jgi:hypothetical protein